MKNSNTRIWSKGIIYYDCIIVIKKKIIDQGPLSSFWDMDKVKDRIGNSITVHNEE